MPNETPTPTSRTCEKERGGDRATPSPALRTALAPMPETNGLFVGPGGNAASTVLIRGLGTIYLHDRAHPRPATDRPYAYAGMVVNTR